MMSEWSSYEKDKALKDAWRAYVDQTVLPIEEGLGDALDRFIDPPTEDEEDEEEEEQTYVGTPLEPGDAQRISKMPSMRGSGKGGRAAGTSKITAPSVPADGEKGDASVFREFIGKGGTLDMFLESDFGEKMEEYIEETGLSDIAPVAIASIAMELVSGDPGEALAKLLQLVPMGDELRSVMSKIFPSLRDLTKDVNKAKKQEGGATDEELSSLLPNFFKRHEDELGPMDDHGIEQMAELTGGILKVYDGIAQVPILGPVIEEELGSFMNSLRALKNVFSKAVHTAPETQMSAPAEELERWKQLAGINTRIL